MRFLWKELSLDCNVIARSFDTFDCRCPEILFSSQDGFRNTAVSPFILYRNQTLSCMILLTFRKCIYQNQNNLECVYNMGLNHFHVI